MCALDFLPKRRSEISSAALENLFTTLLLRLALGGWTLLQAQELHTENGFLLPTRDTVYILVVFAEIDYTECEGGDPYEAQYGRAWPVDAQGRTQVPIDADVLLDATLPPGVAPKGILTRTYAEASFGQFVLLGDYFPEVVRVPCTRMKGSSYSLAQEVGWVIQAWPSDSVYTARGLPWWVFDRWRLLPQAAGLPKVRAPEPHSPTYRPRLDILFILWRNLAYRLGAKPPFPCNYGFGLWSCDMTTPFGPFTGGIEAASSFTTCRTAAGGAVGALVEFFHGLYGGNHWHTAGGAGLHTFPFLPVAPGLSVQGARPVYAIGYDRWLMGWKAPGKQYLISATDELGREVPTDLTQPERPETLRLWLRDFMTTGDAVRIRLPYTQLGGPSVKNQYLWLENRRFRATTEVWPFYAPAGSCADSPPTGEQGFPGLYAYIQVGKDQKSGKDLYTSDPRHPNGLGSWIRLVSAEGRYDFRFRKTPKGWALDRAASLPNPFTGMDDLYISTDADSNGKVGAVELPSADWLEWKGDSACSSWYWYGDKEDAFSVNGNYRLCIETNPPPTPVYTLISSEGYSGSSRALPAPYDNRIIWLNGLHIALLRERPDGALVVEITWDYRTVRSPQRWCGDIRLTPNPFDSTRPALEVRSRIVLDCGESPTYGTARGYDSLEKRYLFTDTTQLVILPAAKLYLSRRGKISLRRGSRLEVQPGGAILGEGQIWLESDTQLILYPGALCSVRIRRLPKRRQS